jgi:hypothetical protein
VGEDGCSTNVAVRKDQIITLPRMGATDANIVGVAVGNLPPRRHGHRLIAIFNKRAIFDFVTMKRHVQVGTVALKKMGRGNLN